MSHQHKVDWWLIAQTTIQAGYMIFFGIVLSVRPNSGTLLQDGYHVHFNQKAVTNEKRSQSNIVDRFETNVPSQFTFQWHTQCHLQFRYHSCDHVQVYLGHFWGHSQFQSQDNFWFEFWSFPSKHTASRRRASAVGLQSSWQASQQSVRSSSRSFHL